MTEAEWLACEDAAEMLESLRERGSDRKFSLFAVAGCYICPWNAIPDPKYEFVVRYVDGGVVLEQLRLIWGWGDGSPWPERPYEWAHSLAAGWENDGDLPPMAELVLCLRDIFGNPFRPVAFSSEWRTDTAITLARQMYEARDFSAMPILADALQDAGCDSEDILTHCRGDGPHVRGCWVVDLVLGKS
jgi:hypothetical protein